MLRGEQRVRLYLNIQLALKVACIQSGGAADISAKYSECSSDAYTQDPSLRLLIRLSFKPVLLTLTY